MPRPFQVTCRCGAYTFPHRLGGGRCKGRAWTETYHLYVRTACEFCNCNANAACEVAAGLEDLSECQAVEEAHANAIDPRLPATELELIARTWNNPYDHT